MTGSRHAHHGPPGGGSWAEMSEELVADAELLSPVRDAALAHLNGLLGSRRVCRVLDFGCGPGVASVALASWFPEAMVMAVDGSAPLLDLASSRAAAAGLANRVTVACADLESEAIGAGSFDVVWASMVLHHLADPDRVLRRLRGRIVPGGWIAVTEFGGPLSILPAADEVVESGVWERFSRASQEALGDHLPNGNVGDWPDRLGHAGFVDVASRECVLDLAAPLGVRQRNWLVGRLGRERRSVAEALGHDDLAVIDRLLDPSAALGILTRPDVFLRVSRSFVAGRRPADKVGTYMPSTTGAGWAHELIT